MEKVKDGIAKPESFSEFEAFEKEYDDISKQLKILDEDLCALKDKIKRLSDRRYELHENDLYEAAFKVVSEHKYWARDKDFSAVAKVDKIEGKRSACFLVTGDEGIDRPHYSSTAGVIYNYPVPITEEKYNEVYNWYKWKKQN